MKTVTMLLLCAGLALLARADPGMDAQRAVARAEIAKLGLKGRWEGSGWIEVPRAGRVAFTGEETVVEKLGGSALLIEGLHRDPKTRAIVHHAVGLLSWDAGTKQYRMATALDFGRGGYFPGRLEDNGFTWSIEPPGAPKMRYTIAIDGDRWVEGGERSADGARWEPFFHMELKRVE